MFNGSFGFSVESSVFNNIAGNLNILKLQENGEGLGGLLLLHQHTSTSALFDAESRFPPPLCHPGTREPILDDLKNWIDSPILVPGFAGSTVLRERASPR
ncbi:hypothetical protein D9757_000011 [Collybiopsis confluens]|uniref:Uncharacterized protein n=1 Tax=Collybiopsis confluens TaxID=2823264 RepID=A0A8H5I2F3_9AGAR|nr:hypothetical protein D9757_000011 [Collybiopsis confluens]